MMLVLGVCGDDAGPGGLRGLCWSQGSAGLRLVPGVCEVEAGPGGL